MIPAWVQKTKADKGPAAVRLFLGLIFVMTGAMKLVVPMLADAWSGQLLAAGLPFHELTRWTVPFLEMGVGVMLLLGLFARLAGVIVIGIMTVATYVHLAVDDPSLFPLQPSEPIVPVAMMGAAAYVVWRGAGQWSHDLKSTHRNGLTEEDS